MTTQPTTNGGSHADPNHLRAVIVLLSSSSEEVIQSLIDSVRSADKSSEVLLVDDEGSWLSHRLSALVRARPASAGRTDGNEVAPLDRDRYLAAKISALTTREKQVLGLLTEGYSNNRIAESLWISQNTVRAHLRSVMRKLNVTNRVQAAAAALRAGLEPRGGNSIGDSHR